MSNMLLPGQHATLSHPCTHVGLDMINMPLLVGIPVVLPYNDLGPIGHAGSLDVQALAGELCVDQLAATDCPLLMLITRTVWLHGQAASCRSHNSNIGVIVVE